MQDTSLAVDTCILDIYYYVGIIKMAQFLFSRRLVSHKQTLAVSNEACLLKVNTEVLGGLMPTDVH